MHTVGYLGPQGSYSSLAAYLLAPDSQKREYLSFPQLFNGLEKGECNAIVLPVENSLNGGVTQNLDLLQSAEGVIAVNQLAVKIDNRLATVKGADASGIKRIYSHFQALAQCGEYLAKNFPQAQLIAVQSTSAGAEAVIKNDEACIVGSHFVSERLSLGSENIADDKNNYTRFLYAVAGGEELLGKTEKIFFSATCKHRTGELVKLLEKIEEFGLNMTKIESRPAKDGSGNYRFFIETEGDYSRPEIKTALENIKDFAGSFKLLGGY